MREYFIMSVKRVQGLHVHKTYEIYLQRWNVQKLQKKNKEKRQPHSQNWKAAACQMVEISNRGYCHTLCGLGNIPMS